MSRLRRFIRHSIDDVLLAAIFASVAAAAIVFAGDVASTSQRHELGREFQLLVGGLGMGCQSDLARCSWQFDPRLMGDDDAPLDVVFGGGDFSPWHAFSLFPDSSSPIGSLEVDVGDKPSTNPQPSTPNPGS